MTPLVPRDAVRDDMPWVRAAVLFALLFGGALGGLVYLQRPQGLARPQIIALVLALGAVGGFAWGAAMRRLLSRALDRAYRWAEEDVPEDGDFEAFQPCARVLGPSRQLQGVLYLGRRSWRFVPFPGTGTEVSMDVRFAPVRELSVSLESAPPPLLAGLIRTLLHTDPPQHLVIRQGDERVDLEVANPEEVVAALQARVAAVRDPG